MREWNKIYLFICLFYYIRVWRSQRRHRRFNSYMNIHRNWNRVCHKLITGNIFASSHYFFVITWFIFRFSALVMSILCRVESFKFARRWIVVTLFRIECNRSIQYNVSRQSSSSSMCPSNLRTSRDMNCICTTISFVLNGIKRCKGTQLSIFFSSSPFELFPLHTQKERMENTREKNIHRNVQATMPSCIFTCNFVQ